MASLKKMIDSFTGASEEEQKQKERLQILKNAAEAHLAIAQSKLVLSLKGEGEGIEKLYIVPDTIMKAEFGYNVSAKEGMDDELKNAVDLFFKGSKDAIKEGFQTIVKSALSALFADTSAGEQEKKFYFVTMEHNVFVRVDLFVWKYYFTQKGITDNVQQAFCYTFVKSIIDHKKVSADTMIFLISEYVGDDMPKVNAFIQELRKLYALLDEKDPAEGAIKAMKLMAT